MHCLTGKTRQMRMEIDMEDKMLTLEKFEEASEIVRKVTQETKLVYSDFYSAQTGGKVYLKPENMQFTGAYKLRGAYYKISTLSEEERAKGLITASAGNHAQGVAYAAKCYGAKAVIVMPVGTPLIKVNRTKNYGAEVILYGDVYDEACARAYELAEEKGYTFIHPLTTRWWQPAREPLPWKFSRSFPWWIIFWFPLEEAVWPQGFLPWPSS